MGLNWPFHVNKITTTTTAWSLVQQKAQGQYHQYLITHSEKFQTNLYNHDKHWNIGTNSWDKLITAFKRVQIFQYTKFVSYNMGNISTICHFPTVLVESQLTLCYMFMVL